ncbi:MAG: hypothetical protein WA996_17555 [Candidatus Promineifilaceae bacterium]
MTSRMLLQEGKMENAIDVLTLFFYVMGGLGLFFTGVGVLWFVTVYRDIHSGKDE